MTAQDHNKMLGIFFAIHAALQGVVMILLGLVYGGLGVAMSASGEREAAVFGTVMLIATIFVFIFGAIIVVPQILAAYKTLKHKPGARFWSIFAAIVALLNFPLGTALGVYALWFLFGEKGKQMQTGSRLNAPPPPPNSWQ